MSIDRESIIAETVIEHSGCTKVLCGHTLRHVHLASHVLMPRFVARQGEGPVASHLVAMSGGVG